MGLRFIRKPSDTPNVQNSDDTRMIRYAYGGYDGYVQKRGNELAPSTSGLNFMIGTGVISLQGYESEIDAGGWEMTFTNSPTKHYYSVYYEVNLATQTTAIKSTVSTSAAGYPDIPASDDLTKTTTGTATLLLYRFEVASGIFTDVQKLVKPIPYTTDTVKDIEDGVIIAGKAISTDTAAETSNDSTIASTEFVKTALANKTHIGESKIRARKLIGSGYAHQSNSYLEIPYSEAVAQGEVLEVVVKLYAHNEYSSPFIAFSGQVLAATGAEQYISSVYGDGSMIELYGLAAVVETTYLACNQGQRTWLNGSSWSSGEYGRIVEVYRYV